MKRTLRKTKEWKRVQQDFCFFKSKTTECGKSLENSAASDFACLTEAACRLHSNETELFRKAAAAAAVAAGSILGARLSRQLAVGGKRCIHTNANGHMHSKILWAFQNRKNLGMCKFGTLSLHTTLHFRNRKCRKKLFIFFLKIYTLNWVKICHRTKLQKCSCTKCLKTAGL